MADEVTVELTNGELTLLVFLVGEFLAKIPGDGEAKLEAEALYGKLTEAVKGENQELTVAEWCNSYLVQKV